MACKAFTPVRIGDASSLRSSITLRAAMPTNTPKITTAIMEVERSLLKSANGFSGIKLSNICGTVQSATVAALFCMVVISAVSRVPATRLAMFKSKP